MKNVNVVIKDDAVISIDKSETNIKLPLESGKAFFINLWERLENLGYLLEGDNMKVST